ncbi:MAG TPA: hypothetical protein VH227_00350 [Candidatus Udaeobacter sp.]|nr:hypothetical protein [Candidatus Udaeobacter sp.]
MNISECRTDFVIISALLYPVRVPRDFSPGNGVMEDHWYTAHLSPVTNDRSIILSQEGWQSG